MSKIEKKKAKILERISILENEMRVSLTKKTSNIGEISIGEYQRKIENLNTELRNLN